MTNRETRQYEMLVRVRDFGERHRDLFPASTQGGEALVAVAEAVRQLNEYTVATLSAANDGKEPRKQARQDLLDQLAPMAKTARALASKTPGFNNVFRLPRRDRDSTLTTAGHMFVAEAGKVKEQFVAYGLPDTFLADAAVAIDRLEEAIRAKATGMTSRSAARTGIDRAMAAGLAAARILDVIVANQLRGDAMTRAEWRTARRLQPGRRGRRGTTAVAPPQSDPVAPVAGVAPASTGASRGENAVTAPPSDTSLKIAS
jgi:hypothetical protein